MAEDSTDFTGRDRDLPEEDHDDGPGPDEVNPLVDLTDDEGDEQGPEDIIEADEGTAAGGTARADAVFGADEVDDSLGDDAPDRPERGDEPGSTTRAPGLAEDEVDPDDEDLDNDEARARAHRDAFQDQLAERQALVRRAYGGGPRRHPASSDVRSELVPEFYFSRDEDGNAICDVCGHSLDEDEVEGTMPADDEGHDDDGEPENGPEAEGTS